MSADKYLSIFSRQMKAIVYLYHIFGGIHHFIVSYFGEIILLFLGRK